MGYCCRKKAGEDLRKERITIVRKEVLQDVADCAYVEGDVLKTEDEHDRHQIQDIVEDGNVERVTRVMDLTFAEIREMLYPYTKQEVTCGNRIDDIYAEAEIYPLEMTVPAAFSQTTLDLIKELAHELMVDRVMADWMSIVNPQKAASWNDKADAAKGRVKSALAARTRRVRRTLSPF